MTIFQKMLIVPLVSLAIYAGFIFYANSRYKNSNESVLEIRDDYIPLLDIAAENNQLFKEISQVFKDAVLAGEVSWIENNQKLKERISYNFFQLKKNEQIVDGWSLNLATQYFNEYYLAAEKFAQSIISKSDDFIQSDDLNLDIELFYNQTKDSFENLRTGIYDRFREKINSTNSDMKQLLFWAGNLSILLILVSTLVTILTSFSTRKNLWHLNRRMKALATGSTDFSRRLKPTSRDELGTLIHWFNKLSVKLEKEHKQLENISNTDKLTQLNNRMSADNFLSKAFIDAMDNGTPLCVAITDIDFFKSINDNFGHHTGDEVLITFAKILKENLRPEDFIARWGGEEFLIILNNTKLDEAHKLIERVRNSIATYQFSIEKNITASFGLTQAKSNESINDLFIRVDKNLYHAKENGRDQIVVDES